jgi:hypothetical protein
MFLMVEFPSHINSQALLFLSRDGEKAFSLLAYEAQKDAPTDRVSIDCSALFNKISELIEELRNIKDQASREEKTQSIQMLYQVYKAGCDAFSAKALDDAYRKATGTGLEESEPEREAAFRTAQPQNSLLQDALNLSAGALKVIVWALGGIGNVIKIFRLIPSGDY